MNRMKLTVLSVFILTGLFLTSCEQEDPASHDFFVGSNLPMNGAQETPAVTTAASGTLNATYSKVTKTLTYNFTWTGLSGPVTAGHIHGTGEMGIAAGVLQGFPGIPHATNWAASGSYSGTLFADGVRIKEEDIIAGRYYVNLHTALRPAGEIRGQILLTRQN